ncbi:rho guanine nucleotide exchange factor 33 [Mixophyes fleayi]|uniref:rho guanine nucleotide exchange factor 33 n=1 Tax=Mixophyes fleayi TaxID=3061075 RepID=UPI003F4DC536
MPFGLSNAPAVFQDLINNVLREFLGSFVVVYLDDILIYSRSLEQHREHVRQVLLKLRHHHLYAKLKKCDFEVSRVTFLGYVISPKGFAMDPTKVQAILDWVQPSNLKAIQSFLGFANYYRKFISSFSILIAPITALTRKGADPKIWSPTAVSAFKALKRAFMSAPVLRHPNPDLPFIIEVDASDVGVRAVISQKDPKDHRLHPCAYLSRKLSSAEEHYDVGNRELLAVKWALEEWCHWLEGAKHTITIYTDHKNLSYIESAKRLNSRLAQVILSLYVIPDRLDDVEITALWDTYHHFQDSLFFFTIKIVLNDIGYQCDPHEPSWERDFSEVLDSDDWSEIHENAAFSSICVKIKENVTLFVSPTGETENVSVSSLPAQIYQLQILASELKTGFTEAMQELSRIQHGEYALEEKVKSCRCTMEEKVTEMKNSLNNLKEEVNTAMAMIHAIIAKQEEMQQKIEQLQQEKRRESRKVKNKIQKEEHTAQTQVPQNSTFQTANHSESMIVNHQYNNLVQTSPYKKAPASRSVSAGSESNIAVTNTTRATHEETDESFKSSVSIEAQSRVYMPSLIWRQPKEGREWDEESSSKEQTDRIREPVQSRTAPVETVLSEPSVFARRQSAAKDLLESERKYVLNLSHILKIRATLQGSDIKRTTKERSFFPSSLRYLIQHHLDLLHILQERVVKWSRQGILGDIFLKLTNDENNFLDYYVAYLKDLPESISVIHIVVLKEAEEDIKSDLYILLFHVVQRIPEYLILLQNVLKYTEQEHPDYYLLLVCVQRLRVFISHYSVLFQYNEDLLIQKRKKLKKSSLIKLYKGLASQCAVSGQEAPPSLTSSANIKENLAQAEETLHSFTMAPGSNSSVTHLVPHVKKSRQTPVETMYPLKSSLEWEVEGKKHDRSENITAPNSFIGTDQEINSLVTPLQSIPEMEYESNSVDAMLDMERSMRTSSNILPDGTFAPNYEEFEYGGEIIGVSTPYEEETFPNRTLYESCSAGSSESSLDICFLRPINFTLESNRTERSQQPLARSCISPVSNSSYRHEGIHAKNKPLSRSLKEFPRNQETVSTRLYSTRSTNASRMQFKQDRSSQSHGLSASARSSHRHFYIPQRPHVESRSLLEDIHMEENARFYHKDETEQTSFSDHHPRSDQKGGFRSSFRKLFKKKSCVLDGKEKTSEKSSIDQSPTRQDIFRTHSALINELDRGTAV